MDTNPANQPKIQPVPTNIKTSVMLTRLELKLKEHFSSLSGNEILSVHVEGSEAKAVVRLQFLFELINLCNTLMARDFAFEGTPVQNKKQREQLLAEALEDIDELFNNG